MFGISYATVSYGGMIGIEIISSGYPYHKGHNPYTKVDKYLKKINPYSKNCKVYQNKTSPYIKLIDNT